MSATPPGESSATERLSGAVARDFNHLLTALGSTVELVRRLTTDERIARLVDAAEISVRRGERLVGRLLAYAGEQVLRPVAVDLDTLLRAPDAPWRRASGDPVALEIGGSTAGALVLLDPDRFHEAIAALIDNARHALGEAGGTVAIATARRDGSVVVTVSDAGVGMVPGIAARASEPFFTTRGESASGRGLSEGRGFAAQSGGELAIGSTPGEGTVVSLQFPALPAADAPAKGVSRASILVVEDDEVVRSLVVEMLEAHEFSVDAAENGTVALHKLGSGRDYDVLFTDIVMPDGPNGVELAERAQEANADLRVLLASGYTRNHLRAVEGLKDGMRFLPKPYRMSQMIAALEALLEFA